MRREASISSHAVSFFLSSDGQPLTNVPVSDGPPARLVYMAVSAQSDRDAVFTTEQNEAGSVVLRWEVGDRLLPGQTGVLRFQAKVR